MDLIVSPIQLALFAAIFAALFSYISNIIEWQQKRRIETIENVAKEFLHLLDILDDSVKSYWSSSRLDLGESEEIVLSSSIKTSVSHIQECMRLIFVLKESGWITKLKKKSISEKQDDFNKMIDKINIHATTGAFEAKERDPSPQIIMESSNAILDLRIRFQGFIYQ